MTGDTRSTMTYAEIVARMQELEEGIADVSHPRWGELRAEFERLDKLKLKMEEREVDPGEVPVLVAAAAERWAIIQDLASSDPHDGDGFCHHCGMLPLTKHDVDDDDGPYVIVGRFTHRPDCLWVRAREAAQHRQEHT